MMEVALRAEIPAFLSIRPARTSLMLGSKLFAASPNMVLACASVKLALTCRTKRGLSGRGRFQEQEDMQRAGC